MFTRRPVYFFVALVSLCAALSLNAVEFQLKHSRADGPDLYAIAAGPDQLVAVGRNGTVFLSGDGENWEELTSLGLMFIRGVTYGVTCGVTCGDGPYVAVKNAFVKFYGTDELACAGSIGGTLGFLAFGEGRIFEGDDSYSICHGLSEVTKKEKWSWRSSVISVSERAVLRPGRSRLR